MATSHPQAVEVRVPAAVAQLHLFDRVDFQDAYSIDTSIKRTPEQWMRAIVEGAPRWFRVAWPAVLGTLAGLDFGPQDASDHVLGWKVVHDRPDVFVVGLESSRGLVVRLIALAPPGHALFATQLRLENAYARRLWSVARPGHRYFAPRLLTRAARRA
jgi:hypothetical protein